MKKQKKVASKNLTPKNFPHNICIDEAGHENVLCKVGLQRRLT